MKYINYLKTMDKCPFCDCKRQDMLLENKGAFLTYALAPYHKYHLLVIPKRHVESIKDISWDENISIMALLMIGIKALDKIGHNDCSILVRDDKSLGKSIRHIHYHIIPGGIIEDTSIKLEVRKLLNKKEEKSLIKELKNNLSTI